MRAFLRCTALIVPLVALMLVGLTPVQAQFKINTFDTAVKDSQFTTVFNATAQATDPKPYHILTDDAANKEEGVAALRSDWRVHTTESWGGLNMLSYTLPTKYTNSFYGNKYRALYGDSTYIDWAGGDHLSLWYNNIVPSDAAGNGVQMRFHIYEAGPGSAYYTGDSTDYEDWYFQSGNVLSDNTPGWHELILPLIDEGHTNSPNASGFSLTDWSGKNKNNVLDWDRIIGYTIEWTSTVLNPDTASGVISYDNLTLGGIGYRAGYAPLYRFNNFALNSADFASGWANDASAIVFSEETSDTLMGTSVMAWDWSIQVAQSWGGGCNRELDLPASTYFPDLSATHEIQLYAKVVKPLTSTHGAITNKITMRFVLFDYSDGTKEEWYTVAPIRMDSAALKMGWQMIRMPIDWIQSGAWGDLKVGRFNTPNGTKDGIMAYDKIGGFKIEFSCSADAGEPASDPTLVYSGKVLFSAAIPAGFRQSDHTPPASVTGVQVLGASKANVIAWTDVPGETGATYTAYVSEKPFATTDDPGVENIPPFGLPVGTQVATHLLRSANTDQQLSFYYGVTATDAAGNTNQPTVVGPVSNMAQGVPTLSLTPPANFVADGDLSEWAGIKPFVLSVVGANATAHVVTNYKIDGDADLKVTAYLAVDTTALYVAFDVVDDVVSIDTSKAASSWLQDSPDLFIGLYDWRGKHHAAYGHGATPDYHLRFAQNRIIIDNDGKDPFMRPGPNYNFSIKQIESGYTVEAKIPWTLFHDSVATDNVFKPVEGMRIPIDFEINDNDSIGRNLARQGIMAYAPLNQDNSYSDLWRWTYTWIGNKMSTTGVNTNKVTPNVYTLMQNYPNPFNPSTQIRYSLGKDGHTTIKVYDILGREVTTLVNELQKAGEHTVAFNSATIRSGLASGVYFYRIESGSFLAVKKMMLLK